MLQIIEVDEDEEEEDELDEDGLEDEEEGKIYCNQFCTGTTHCLKTFQYFASTAAECWKAL